MRILIENYRGFDIEFDTDYEKFLCIITDEQTKESVSYKSVKSFVDEYKKKNQEFKPFWVDVIPSMYVYSKKLKIVGIRKDGRFISETEDGKKSQVSDYDLDKYMISKPENEPILCEYKELEELSRKYVNEVNEQKKVVFSKLNILTLKKFKETIV